jgi:co-chaperonin GroES (HSP10)
VQYSTVKPSGDRVLVKPGGTEAKTPGGILLPTAAESAQNEGQVIAVGDVQAIKVQSKLACAAHASSTYICTTHTALAHLCMICLAVAACWSSGSCCCMSFSLYQRG